MDKNLAVYEERAGSGGDARYRLLETVRQYARDRLVESGEGEAVHDRHRDYYLAFAEEAHTFFDGPEQAFWYALVEREHDNLRAALEWCRVGEHGAQAGLRLATALWEFWNVRGHVTEVLQWLDEVTRWEGAKEPTARRAYALNGAGVLAVTRGDFAAAHRFLDESLAIWRGLGSAEVVHTLNSLAYLASRRGDPAGEEAFNEEALRVARSAGDRRFTLYPLRGLGELALKRGDLVQARVYLEESVAVAREFGDQKGLIWSLASLADIKNDLGDAEGAYALRDEGAALAAQLQDARGLLHALHQLAHRAMMRGEYSRARALWAQGLKAAKEAGDTENLGWAQFDLAVLAQYEGDGEQARRLFEQGLSLIRQTGDGFMTTIAVAEAAWHAWWRGDLDAAAFRSDQEESLTRFRQMGREDGLPWAKCRLAWAVHAQGDYGLAGTLFREALSVPSRYRDQELFLWCLEGLARVGCPGGRGSTIMPA